MPGVGVGGLFSNLFNPGLDDRLAQHIMPNPNPLAQQGGPPNPKGVDSLGNPVPIQQPNVSNLAPAAVTQPDPVNSSYAADLLKAHRQDALSADLNRNLEGMAAGFGTAAQQQSKQNALARGGGGVGDSLAALKDIQGMQDQTIADNEHARFMGNAAVFAQTLSQSLGRPVSVQEATEIMNSPDLMKQFGGAAAANAQTPDKLKEADAEARAWADAHLGATPQEIAQHKSDFLAQTAGGLSMIGKQLAEDRRNWRNAHPGKSDAEMIADKPELADETTYVAIKGEQGKQMAQAGVEKQTAVQTFPKVDQAYAPVEANIEWLSAPEHRAAVEKAIATPGLFTRDVAGNLIAKVGVGGVDQDVLDARSKIDFLKNELYKDNFTGTHNIRSNTEANKIAGSATNLDTQTNSAATIDQQLKNLKTQIYRERADTYAAAGKAVPYKYHGLADSTYLDPKSNLYNGGKEEEPVTITSPEDIARLPSGRAFVIPSGVHKGEIGYAP